MNYHKTLNTAIIISLVLFLISLFAWVNLGTLYKDQVQTMEVIIGLQKDLRLDQKMIELQKLQKIKEEYNISIRVIKGSWIVLPCIVGFCIWRLSPKNQ